MVIAENTGYHSGTTDLVMFIKSSSQHSTAPCLLRWFTSCQFETAGKTAKGHVQNLDDSMPVNMISSSVKGNRSEHRVI